MGTQPRLEMNLKSSRAENCVNDAYAPFLRYLLRSVALFYIITINIHRLVISLA